MSFFKISSAGMRLNVENIDIRVGHLNNAKRAASPINDESVKKMRSAIKVIDQEGPDITHIIHSADWHARGGLLHDRSTKEMKEAMATFTVMVGKEPAGSLHVVCGDIVHNKQRITPELNVQIIDYFDALARQRPTVVIIGNHDMNVHDVSRPSALSAILHKKKIPNLYLLEGSGIYRFRNIHLVVWSLVDNLKIPASECPVDAITVALYHGTVDGSKNQVGHLLKGNLKLEEFDGFDLVCLGDVHKHQCLRPNVGYPGSLVCQNFGEIHDPHGYLVWDLKQIDNPIFRDLPNPYEKRVYDVNTDNDGRVTFDPPLRELPDLPDRPLPSNGFFRIRTNCDSRVVEEAKSRIRQHTIEPTFDNCLSNLSEPTTAPPLLCPADQAATFRSPALNVLGSTLLEYMKEVSPPEGIDNPTVLKRLDKALESASIDSACGQWHPVLLEWSNLFAYGQETSKIDFEELRRTSSICGITGRNRMGKSSIVDIWTWVLYAMSPRIKTMASILRKGEKAGWAQLIFRDTQERTYKIRRELTRDAKQNVNSTVHLWHQVNGEWIAREGFKTGAKATIEGLVGKYKTFVYLNFHLQKCEQPLWAMTEKELHDFLAPMLGLQSSFQNIAKKFDSEKKDTNKTIDENNGEIKNLRRDLSEGTFSFEQELQNLDQGITEAEGRLKMIMVEKGSAEVTLDIAREQVDKSMDRYLLHKLEQECQASKDNLQQRIVDHQAVKVKGTIHSLKMRLEELKPILQREQEIEDENARRSKEMIALNEQAILMDPRVKQLTTEMTDLQKQLSNLQVKKERSIVNLENLENLGKVEDMDIIERSLKETLELEMRIAGELETRKKEGNKAMEAQVQLDLLAPLLKDAEAGLVSAIEQMETEKMALRQQLQEAQVRCDEIMDSLQRLASEMSLFSDIMPDWPRPTVSGPVSSDDPRRVHQRICDTRDHIRALSGEIAAEFNSECDACTRRSFEAKEQLRSLEKREELLYIELDAAVAGAWSRCDQQGADKARVESQRTELEGEKAELKCRILQREQDINVNELETRKIRDALNGTYQSDYAQLRMWRQESQECNKTICNTKAVTARMPLLQLELKNAKANIVSQRRLKENLEKAATEREDKDATEGRIVEVTQVILTNKEETNRLQDSSAARIREKLKDLQDYPEYAEMKNTRAEANRTREAIDLKVEVERANESVTQTTELLKRKRQHVDAETLVSALKETHNRLAKSMIQVLMEVQSLEKNRKGVDKHARKCKCLEEENVLLQREHALLTYLSQLVSTKGLTLFALKRLLPHISDEISRMVSAWMDFKINLLHNEDKNTVRVEWQRRSDGTVIDVHSGMEEFVAGVMTKIALGRCARLPRTDTLMIDEGVSVMDTENMAALDKFLDVVRPHVPVCLLVTHIDAGKEAVDRQMEVTRTKAGHSRLTM